MNEDLFAALWPVVDALDRLGIEYSVGGSVASSYHGIPRSTADADLVAAFPPAKVDEFVAALGQHQGHITTCCAHVGDAMDSHRYDPGQRGRRTDRGPTVGHLSDVITYAIMLS